tara:strand:+ start:295 stop:1128 length:834 start_codon:yes stop_codon:yes gene_type:complete
MANIVTFNLFGTTLSIKRKSKMGRPKGSKTTTYKRNSSLKARNLLILEEWNTTGATYKELATKHGVGTRERVRQIINILRSEGRYALEARSEEKRRLKFDSKYGDFDAEKEVLKRYKDTDYYEWKDGLIRYNSAQVRLAEKRLRKIGKIFPRQNRTSRKLDYTHRYKFIKEMKAKDKTLDQIAEAMNIGRVRVAQHIKEMRELGYQFERGATTNLLEATSLPEKEIKRRSEMIMEGMRTSKPMRIIAKEIGLNLANVYRHKAKYINEKVYEDWLKKQ